MNWLIMLAGGSGTRMNAGINKVFLKIQQKPILCWNLQVFNKSPIIDKIIVCTGSKDFKKVSALVKKYHFQKVIKIIETNLTRQGNAFATLKWLENHCQKNDLVGIHNAANPFITFDEIKKLYTETKKNRAALLAYPSTDTIKISDENNFAIQTPKRENCWSAQTPQAAEFSLLLKAHQKADQKNFTATDDSQLLNLIGIPSKIVQCSINNFKITYPQDLEKCKTILKINPQYATCWSRSR
jgi:2-C-methyl-D-erythritol 4-phosphate cytidylyltransferase